MARGLVSVLVWALGWGSASRRPPVRRQRALRGRRGRWRCSGSRKGWALARTRVGSLDATRYARACQMPSRRGLPLWLRRPDRWLALWIALYHDRFGAIRAKRRHQIVAGQRQESPVLARVSDHASRRDDDRQPSCVEEADDGRAVIVQD